jgi:hypothetical protein
VGESKAVLTVYGQELSPDRTAAWEVATRTPCIQDGWMLEVVDPYDEIRRQGGFTNAAETARGGAANAALWSRA